MRLPRLFSTNRNKGEPREEGEKVSDRRSQLHLSDSVVSVTVSLLRLLHPHWEILGEVDFLWNQCDLILVLQEESWIL